jgi:acyl-CoA thioesterase I
MPKLIASLLLWFLASSATAGTLLVLGDSLSAGYGLTPGQGWVDLLQQRLEQRGDAWRVVNASISGDTTAGGRSRLPAALERYQPDVLVLELGANDGLRGLSLTAMKRNLNAMIEQARAAGAHVLLIGMQMPPNYGPRYTQGFSAIYAELAAEHEVPLVPFLLERVALDAGLMLSDNLHPNARAQPLLLDTVWPQLEPMLLDTRTHAAVLKTTGKGDSAGK